MFPPLVGNGFRCTHAYGKVPSTKFALAALPLIKGRERPRAKLALRVPLALTKLLSAYASAEPPFFSAIWLFNNTSKVCNRGLHTSKKSSKKNLSGRDGSDHIDRLCIVVSSLYDTAF